MLKHFLLCSAIALAACGSSSDDDDNNSGEPTVVNRFDVDTYTYYYSATGFTPDGEWRIRVENGSVVAVESLDSDEPDVTMTVETAPTVLDLLARINACADSEQCEITTLEYDQTYYYPTDYYGSEGEEGSGFEVSLFLKGVHKSFDDFEADVANSVDPEADHCGVVDIDESQVDTNTCVADAFVNGRTFYAVYRLQGFDSSVGAALSGDSEGRVWKWRYDSNPAGGVPAAPSKIESTECLDADFSGSVDSGYEQVFLCEEGE